MSFDQKEYTKVYNKEKYKMYQFRIKKDNKLIIDHLDNVKNRNEYIGDLISNDLGIKNKKDVVKYIFNENRQKLEILNYMKKKFYNIIISVDAGGTSTKYACIDDTKEIIYRAYGGSGSPAVNENAINDIFESLEQIYNDICYCCELKGIVIGMSGFALVNVSEFKKRLENRFNTKVILDNDANLALYSVLENEHKSGMVVISGTGAIVCAVNKDKKFITNGWGELLTERGSAYGCVRDFIVRMIKHHEEGLEYTYFEKSFMEYCGCKVVEDFKLIIYKQSKNEVAKLSEIFLRFAEHANKEADEWLSYNGELLAIDAINALNRVGMDKSFVIGFRGGFINSSLKHGFKTKMKEFGYEPIYENFDQNPIIGGYYIAKKEGLI